MRDFLKAIFIILTLAGACWTFGQIIGGLLFGDML